MKVLHTISGLSVFGGGPSLSTLLTVQGLRHSGVEADILTYKPTQKDDKLISTAGYIHVLDAMSVCLCLGVRFSIFVCAILSKVDSSKVRKVFFGISCKAGGIARWSMPKYLKSSVRVATIKRRCLPISTHTMI